MLCTLDTHRMDAAPEILYVPSSIYSYTPVLMAIPVQTPFVFLCEVVYAYHNSFLSLMRGIRDVRILAMLFSCCSRQAVHRRKYKSRPFLNGHYVLSSVFIFFYKRKAHAGEWHVLFKLRRKVSRDIFTVS